MIDWRQFLTSDKQVCHGQLWAKGTRVFVTTILDSLAEGATREADFWQRTGLRAAISRGVSPRFSAASPRSTPGAEIRPIIPEFLSGGYFRNLCPHC